MLHNDVVHGDHTATRWTACCTHHLHWPATNAEVGPSSQIFLSIEWDAHLDPSGPSFELLHGGSLSPSKSHNTCHVVLIWRSELSCAEGTTLVANCHLIFMHQALTEAQPMDKDGKDDADNGKDAAGDIDRADVPTWGGF